METDKNILNKTPQQIFDELTANMDTRSKYEYVKFMHGHIFAGGSSLWKIIRFAHVVFGMYSTDRPHTIYAKQIHDVCNELYTPSGSVPKYLHGVIDKQTKKYKHPYDRLFIVKPMRGMSQQYMAQYRKVADILQYFERVATIPSEGVMLPVASEMYNELQKLISMTRVCMVTHAARDIMKTGSVQMLQEYNMYASTGTVSNAANARCKITESRKSRNKKTRQFLRDMNAQELRRLSLRHDAELTQIANFDELQKILCRHEQERSELLAKQRVRIREFEKTFAKSKQQEIQDRNSVRLNTQLKMARVSRMR